MKYSIFNIKILSVSNDCEMKDFKNSVNLAFEVYYKVPVQLYICISNKVICRDFSEGPFQIMNYAIFKFEIL